MTCFPVAKKKTYPIVLCSNYFLGIEYMHGLIRKIFNHVWNGHDEVNAYEVKGSIKPSSWYTMFIKSGTPFV